MAIKPGSTAELNVLNGFATCMMVTTTEIAGEHGASIIPEGLTVCNKTTGEIFIGDGVTALNALTPRVDKLLNKYEKAALTKTFAETDGSVQKVQGALAVLGAEGKLDLDVIPTALVEHKAFKVVADIAARDEATDEDKRFFILVLDASADDTVTAGAATYVWNADANEGAGEWVKIHEMESMDVVIPKASYEDVQAAGGVMYDHPVHIKAPTLAEYAALAAATPAV